MKHYFSFNGRIGRKEYFLSYLAVQIISMFFTAIPGDDAFAVIMFLLMLVSIVPILWFIYAQGAKRCHDMGFSGWFQLIPLFVIVMFFMRGEDKINQYGAPCK